MILQQYSASIDRNSKTTYDNLFTTTKKKKKIFWARQNTASDENDVLREIMKIIS